MGTDGDGRIRVLWLIKGLGPGGAERLLVHHARARDRERFAYEVAYLVPEKSHLVPELTQLGLAVTCYDSPRTRDVAWVPQLFLRLRRDPVDVIHVHSPLLAAKVRVMVRALPRRIRPAVVTTEHNEWGKHRSATRWANRLTMGLDDHTVAVASGVRESMHRSRRGDVEVLVHGIDLATVRDAADRAGARDELGIGHDELVVVTVANYRREKAYDVLMAAARKVIDETADVRFVAVGQGPLAGEIEDRHRRLHLGDRMILTGYRPDAVRIMSAGDIFCLASRHEGLPVALMEALALGLPVVATDVGGVGEVVRSAGVGRVVHPDRTDDLVDALEIELADDEVRRAHAAAAVEAAERFSVVHAVDRLEEIYAEVA
ncbi:MAG: glycosyltransferase [Acidimicrobiales bacterium]